MITDYKNLLETAIVASIEAGEEILKVYNSDDFNIRLKTDNSPLTEADLRAHKIIVSHLEKHTYPILSEEGKAIDFRHRKAWQNFWCVDPLDGTKEFIKRNGEFTVNIAFISGNKTILGVIYVPVLKTLYFGAPGIASHMVENISPGQHINTNWLQTNGTPLPLHKNQVFTVVASRSHLSAETEEFIDTLRVQHGNVEFLSRGSSLKICMVAEGKADIYPRYAPTMEWDTAAGHAIAKHAGFNIYQAGNSHELEYNKENLLNPYFIVK